MAHTRDAYRRLLEAYAAGSGDRADHTGRRFTGLLAANLAVCCMLGVAILGAELPAEPLVTSTAGRQASFVLQPPRENPAPPPPPAVAEPEVEDLTQDPLLGQVETRPVQEPVPEAPATAQAPEEEPAPAPRKVYGLRRVFAKGLGSGAGGAGTVISKRGNTLEKEPDSLTATPEDLVGALAPLSQVTRAPELRGRAKPVYTEAMIANRIEGVVKARLLVDVDGRVTSVEMIEHIGYGSREAATAAFYNLRFEPALRGDRPAAAWIVMKYRFVLQE